ncbi:MULTISPECIES: DUF742 domain-containing protein [unclassified Streptomyces]|uniref:DUF742 domain-containing protein n=1 Tax=unclassified Streptomyces TaxID=2593676 RepID=UPI00124F7990|nr:MULTISPECIES: DUF742 domain-containing protein [unclassified Streptomyces]KAB2975511.1 DUF742 domain-containing protein [Streptomyces sp. SS1-1]MDI9830382.1 DUF742 domain-containing protein [Streptomyces sp. KAU_LT]
MSDAHDSDPEVELTSALVPFFVITNGRALPPDQQYERTALVTAHKDTAATARTLAPEEKAIMDLVANRMLAVAEIAGRTHLPLGIVRILLSQLEESGLVLVRKPAPRADSKDRELLSAVLEGLKNIGA